MANRFHRESSLIVAPEQPDATFYLPADHQELLEGMDSVTLPEVLCAGSRGSSSWLLYRRGSTALGARHTRTTTPNWSWIGDPPPHREISVRGSEREVENPGYCTYTIIVRMPEAWFTRTAQFEGNNVMAGNGCPSILFPVYYNIRYCIFIFGVFSIFKIAWPGVTTVPHCLLPNI